MKTKIFFISIALVIFGSLFWLIGSPKNVNKQSGDQKLQINDVDLTKKQELEKKSALPLKSSAPNALINPGDKDKKTHLVELDFFRLKDGEFLESQSGFGETYKKVKSFEISSKINEFTVVFDRPVSDVASVVIIVNEGEIELLNFQLNKNQDTKGLKQLFEGDWVKRKPLSSLKKIQFLVKPLTSERTTLSLYVQYLGD